jgi:hypothetical protein
MEPGGGIPSAEAFGTPVILQLHPARMVASGSLDLTVGNQPLPPTRAVSADLVIGSIGTVLGAFDIGYRFGALFGLAEAWAVGLIAASTVANELRKLWP